MELDTSSIEKRFAFGFLQQLLRWMDISQEFIAHLGRKNSLLLSMSSLKIHLGHQVPNFSQQVLTEHQLQARLCFGHDGDGLISREQDKDLHLHPCLESDRITLN